MSNVAYAEICVPSSCKLRTSGGGSQPPHHEGIKGLRLMPLEHLARRVRRTFFLCDEAHYFYVKSFHIIIIIELIFVFFFSKQGHVLDAGSCKTSIKD